MSEASDKLRDLIADGWIIKAESGGARLDVTRQVESLIVQLSNDEVELRDEMVSR